jgi:hypothetical protein
LLVESIENFAWVSNKFKVGYKTDGSPRRKILENLLQKRKKGFIFISDIRLLCRMILRNHLSDSFPGWGMMRKRRIYMPNDPKLRERISKLSNEDLEKMVKVDFEDYVEEALQYAEAEMRMRGIPNENYEIENTPRTDRQVSPLKVEINNEGRQRFDEHINAPNEDYLVIPFIGKIKSGFFSSENAETVSRQLQSLINQYSRQGWEFYSVAKVDIEVTPGCLAGLFGAKTSYVTFDQVVFRRSKP